MVYRIRHKGMVVGYLREEGGYTLYSRDLYGWTGETIAYDCRERDTGLRDKNNRRLFDGDVVRVVYYRNPVALRLRKTYLGMVYFDDKNRLKFRVLTSGEVRGAAFLKEAVSAEYHGTMPVPPPPA